MIFEVMVIECPFMGRWIRRGKHVRAIRPKDVAFAIDIIQSIDFKAEVVKVWWVGTEVDVPFPKSVKQVLWDDVGKQWDVLWVGEIHRDARWLLTRSQP